MDKYVFNVTMGIFNLFRLKLLNFKGIDNHKSICSNH